MSDQPTNPNELQTLFTRGGMSRRAFMRNAAVLGLSLSAAQLLLAACAAPAAPTGDVPAAEAPADTTMVYSIAPAFFSVSTTAATVDSFWPTAT